jgi:hypothetical protein
MNKTSIYISLLFVSLIVFGFPVFGGCTGQGSTVQEEGGFAIYLTKDDILPERMEMMSYVEIAEEPVLSVNDIESYDAVTHEMKISIDAYERIDELEVTTRGKSFLVCVDKNPIYWGTFWTLFSSMSFDGVTIWKTLGINPGVIKLELGYPGAGFFHGKDPRNNLEVMKSLKKSGKLVNEISVTLIDELPHSLKGYELYSWQEGETWHYRLITGTNRTKTLEEITFSDDMVNGWISVHVTGTDALKVVLSKLPEGECISWGFGMKVIDTSGSGISLTFPGEQIMNEISSYAETCGLDLMVE